MPYERELLRLCREGEADVCLYVGEVLGIVGETATGKTRLAKILSGLDSDKGRLLLMGEKLSRISDLRDNVGYIGAADATIRGLCVSENIFLGRTGEYSRLFFVDKRKMHAATMALLREVGLCRVEATSDVESLCMGEKKLVELARVLSRKPRVLIFDGVYSVLEFPYRKKLNRFIRKFVRSGGSVVFCTRDGEHCVGLCDRIYILNEDGSHTQTINVADYARRSETFLGQSMGAIHKEVTEEQRHILLRAVNLCVRDRLKNISFRIENGEILGVVGLSHSGIHTLGRVIYGACPTERGRVTLGGVRIRRVEDALRKGMLYASSDFGRELLCEGLIESASIIILDSVMSGLCYEARERMLGLIRQIKQSRRSAILISEDIDAQMQICDRIIALYHGRIVGELCSEQGFDKQKILALITGEGMT